MDRITRFLGLAWSLERVRDRIGATSEVSDHILMEMLQDTAGTHLDYANQLIYRPYYVAAKQLQQDIQRQTVIEANGVTFTGLLPVIASLMNHQRALDLALNLLIPPGMEAPLLTADGSPFMEGQITKKRVGLPPRSYAVVNTHF